LKVPVSSSLELVVRFTSVLWLKFVCEIFHKLDFTEATQL